MVGLWCLLFGLVPLFRSPLFHFQAKEIQPKPAPTLTISSAVHAVLLVPLLEEWLQLGYLPGSPGWSCRWRRRGLAASKAGEVRWEHGRCKGWNGCSKVLGKICGFDFWLTGKIWSFDRIEVVEIPPQFQSHKTFEASTSEPPWSPPGRIPLPCCFGWKVHLTSGPTAAFIYNVSMRFYVYLHVRIINTQILCSDIL